MLRIIVLLLLPFTANGQMRVLFADSLEQRSETVKIILHGMHQKYDAIKFGTRATANFKKTTTQDTISVEQEMKKAPGLAFLDKSHGLNSKALHTRAAFNVVDRISYDVVRSGKAESSVHASRLAVRRVSNIKSQNSTLSQVFSDTSFVVADIALSERTSSPVEISFQGEGLTSINGIVLDGTDTLYLRMTDKAKKYHALGVELTANGKVIAGLQLPDMHIGPSYFVVDKSLSPHSSSLAYAVLSLVLHINENRNDRGE